jgi:uncharacterized membrane protein YgdD (TMEM256/DUF423 family)
MPAYLRLRVLYRIALNLVMVAGYQDGLNMLSLVGSVLYSGMIYGFSVAALGLVQLLTPCDAHVPRIIMLLEKFIKIETL